MRAKVLFYLFCITLAAWNCSSDSTQKASRVVIGVPADVENLNPLFAFGLLEGSIREIMYPGLVIHKWDDASGEMIPSPSIAQKWEWSNDSSSITFYLREDVFWSDSVKLTSEDIVFSFDIYSDPLVSSTFYGGFDNFYTDGEQRIQLDKSFEVLSPTKIRIKFKPNTSPTLFDIDMPVLPKHVLSKIPRRDLSTTNIEKILVTSGAYKLSDWKRNESISLKAVTNSFLASSDMVKELIFKIIPDENSRITQLRKGEIDLIEDVGTEFISDLKKEPQIKVTSRTGRDYDFIGWNNIDPKSFGAKKTMKPNKFFGSANVRKALSYAINKAEILEEYLHGYGQLSFSPLSPIFTNYYSNEIKPYEFNPTKAKELLSAEGWLDKNNDGVIEKNNVNFSFTLYIGSGNSRREYAATIVRNNLKAIGIEVKIETLEMSTFVNKIFERELDAFIAGWTVPIPLDLQPYWHSNFTKSPLNLYGFNQPEIDRILDDLQKEKSLDVKKQLYKNFQKLIHEFEPVTFLYWLDIVTAYNARIKNITINPLGAIQHCWEWRVNGN
ncbi:MAG: hypothetical protein HXY50_12080 [Ignavibacteriaceae bacterium]|nr:hypothetical protein [Ignavibacteriaceae bacterium]